jgi:hypothetical protein
VSGGRCCGGLDPEPDTTPEGSFTMDITTVIVLLAVGFALGFLTRHVLKVR